MIQPETIAECLAKLCRFKGHCRGFYSVAQHSLFVSDLVVLEEVKLPALLHDAHEAYDGFGDIARPAKYLNGDVSSFLVAHRRSIDVEIARRFGFDPDLFLSDEIHEADLIALATERRDIMGQCDREWDSMPPPCRLVHIQSLTISEAKQRFLARLMKLWRGGKDGEA
jgi:5'-deoxynucleotidase YfbR-like HD superfamily hydrolase